MPGAKEPHPEGQPRLDFPELLMRLCVSRPSSTISAGHVFHDLPVQPIHKVKDLPGCRTLLTPGDCAVFDIPVQEGDARIVGTVHAGDQTLRDAVAVLFNRPG